MPGTSGLPLAGVEAIVEGLTSFQGDVRQMNSALDSIHPRTTLLQRGFESLTSGIIGFGKGILEWGVNSLVSFGESIIHIAEYALGQLLADAIEWVITKLKELASATIEAGSEFQTLEIRLNGLNMQEISDSQLDYMDATEAATKMTREQLEWLQKLAASTPFDNTDISNVYTLSRTYGFADDAAKQLTESTIEFTAGMGLSKEVLERVIMNLGQMVQRGKITSTEIRDLARGAFLPVNDILERIVKNMNETGQSFIDNSGKIDKSSEKIEDYQDKLQVLQQKQSEFTEKTKESTKLSLKLQIADLQEKIDLEKKTLGALQTATNEVTMKDVMAQISTKEGLPAQLFIDAFNEMIAEEPRFQGAAERMAVTFKAASDNALDIVKSIGGLNIVKPVLDVIGGKIAGFTAEFTDTDRWDKLVAAANRVGQALSWIMEDIFSFLPSAGNLADAVVSTVNRVADWLQQHRMDIAMFFKGAVDFIVNTLIPTIVRIFTTIQNAIKEFTTSGFSVDFLETLGFKPETAEKIIGFIDKIKEGLDRFFSWIQDNGPTIKQFFKTVGEIVSDFFSDLTGGREGKAKGGDILDSITKFMQFVIDNKDKIVKWVEILWSVFIVWQVLSTLWNIVIGVVITLGGFILGLIGVLTALGAVLAAPVIGPIMLVIAALGALIAVVVAVYSAFKNNMIGIRDIVAWAINGVISLFNTMFPFLGSFMSSFINVFVSSQNHIRGMDWAGLGRGIISAITGGISSGLGSLISMMASLGNMITGGISSGIESGTAGVVAKVTTVAGKLTTAAQKKLKSRSPSLVFEELGMFTMEGLALGIEKAAGMAVGAMQNAVGAVVMPAMSSMALARAGGDTITNERNYNLTVNSSSPVEPILQDFNMLASLTGA